MKNLIYVLLALLVFSCGKDDDQQVTPDPNNPNTPDWLISSDEVFDGGPGKDGIPSVDNPKFANIALTNYLQEDDLVVGIVVNGEAKAYPHVILDWHEIVNDDLGGANYALTYCPLTGSAIAWDRDINGTTTTFGVSGKLYNTNLLPYDRETDSYWSQMRLDCVNGELIGTEISTYPIIETTWSTWKAAYPNSQVQTTETGFNRNYGQYPYGDYITNNNRLIFPVNVQDNRLPGKERVYGVITDAISRVYSIELFENGRAIEDELNGNSIIVIGSKTDNYIVGFENMGLTNLQFVANQLPIIAQDGNGNKITLSGEIVEGPLSGTQLKGLDDGFIAYYFSLGAFYKDIEIFQN